jgi:hypothetical protein
MKLHISVWRETTSLVPVINKNLSAIKSDRRFTESPFIGAPTESPLRKTKAMKIKSMACAAAVAALCTINSFATEPLGAGFTYQGRLNDGGTPANGNYDMIFNLYDAPTNGNVLGSFSIFGAVPVTNGLFTLELNTYGEFGPNAFNGQARWLQIGVRTNNNNAGNPWVNLSPRQPLDPAPHALYALNAGSSINASFATNASFASNASSVAWANITGIPAGFADGVDNDTTYSAGAGLNLSGANQFSVNYAGSGVATTASRSDHGHFGAVWGGNQSFGLGLSVTNGAANGAGLYGQQGTGSGFPYAFGNTAGVWGEATQGSGVYGASATFRGVQGVSLGAQGSGVYGTALNTSGVNFGVQGVSASTQGVGVFGNASATTGANCGVQGVSASTQGVGVSGFAQTAAGASYGVFGKTASTNGTGVYGLSGNIVTNSERPNLSNAGILGESSFSSGVVGVSDNADGIHGSSYWRNGVVGEAFVGDGVDGISQDGTGVYGYAPGASFWSGGVSGYSDNGFGVSGYSGTYFGVSAASSTGVPLYAELDSLNTSANIIEGWQWGGSAIRRFRVTGGGDVYASGAFHPNGADFAEMLPAQDALEAGDVLVINEDGKLAKSALPNQPNVAGVHATQPGLIGGAEDGADLTGKVPLAVVGVVPVKVTAENGPIKPGDKLTTSSTAGHAMKADKHPEVGTVIGKALTALEGKQGVIQMLVVLQ